MSAVTEDYEVSDINVLDIVGATEAADILEVEVPRIARWRKSGRLPAPALVLAATPIWHRVTIEWVAAGSEGEPPDVAPLHDRRGPLLLGTSEAAAALGKDKSQIGRWRRADRFPEPFRVLASGPLWPRDAIAGFDA